MARILVIDDDPGALQFAASALAGEHEVATCLRGDEGIARASEQVFDVVLTDLAMPPPDGFDVLRALTVLREPPAVIVLTATDRAASTLDALRLGARDYVVKPSCEQELQTVIARALSGQARAAEPHAYGLVGRSTAIRHLRQLIPLLGRSKESVLITGETGTGKEVLARALHEHGPRAGGPFVAHNVAVTPAELAESLFFGHDRGAFTGAHADHAGLFEQAHGGTLFLDELDSLSLGLQAKLLRTLESLRVQRVGGTTDRAVDVRIVAASATDPARLVERGVFRADLYYRVRQLEVELPPLRQRMEDVPLLIGHVLGEYSRERARVYRL